MDGRQEALRRIWESREAGQLRLDLNRLGLVELPEELWLLESLQSLHLSSNQLSSLPKEFAQLKELRTLDLRNNQLSSLPLEITQLKNLQALDLSGNQLSSLPQEFAQLKNLQNLNLSLNQLSSLPLEITQLKKLQDLDLGFNQLSFLPLEITQLKKLQILDLMNNQLSSLPQEFMQLKKLQHLYLINNSPQLDQMQDLWYQNPEDFWTFLRSLQEDAKPIYEGKLLLVGEGAVGKSSLLAALRNQEFQEDRATTHGIEVAPLPVPHPELDETMHLRAWDFGGQEVYRVSHQFFYSPRALYLLLWEPRRGVEQCDVEGWIRRIKLRVDEEARILIIATHCHEGDRVVRIDKDVLLRDHGDVIEGFFEVDSKDGHGIDELRTAISKAAAALPQMGEPFSARWQAVRDRLKEEKVAHLPIAQVRQLCQDEGLDDDERRVLLSLLHDIGDLIYFGEDKGLGDQVILDPEWLAKAISLVLEDGPTNRGSGILDHRRLRAIWTEHSKKTEPTYETDLHPFLLRLMELYDVSYRIEGEQKSLVAQLVPPVRPELPWTADQLDLITSEEGWIVLACELSEDPPGLVPWMIVRTHRFAPDIRHWQKGTFLDYGQHGQALLELRKRELWISVRASWPRHFMSILRDTLEVLAKGWQGLDMTFSVPCPTISDAGEPCEGRFPLDGMLKRKRKGKSEVPCLHCDDDWSLDRLLTGFEGPDLLAEIQEFRKESRESAQAHSSEAAAQHWALIRALGSEGHFCPATFTLLPEDLDSWNPLDLGKTAQRLTLWCEHPDHPHPVWPIGTGLRDGEEGRRGEYIFPVAGETLRKMAPLMRTVAATLKLVVPIAGAMVKAGLDEALLDDVKPKLELMEKVTRGLLADAPEELRKVEETDTFRTHAEGAALRQLHSLLLELDPDRTWGGLRRILTPTGDWRWLCPQHYKEYDPGLPVLPKQD